MYTINGVKIEIDDNLLTDPNSDMGFREVLKERLMSGKWESEEAEYIKLLNPDSTVLELGACIGYISNLTNKLLTNKEKHVVVEANPKLIPVLENNKIINDAKFSIENVILSDIDNDDVSFFLDKRSILGSTLNLIPKNRILEEMTLKTTTLNTLQNKYNLKFDALICDIEGGEYDLFENCLTDDILPQFKYITVEFHWNEKNSHSRYYKIIERLEKLNFQLIKIKASTGQMQIFGVLND